MIETTNEHPEPNRNNPTESESVDSIVASHSDQGLTAGRSAELATSSCSDLPKVIDAYHCGPGDSTRRPRRASLCDLSKQPKSPPV